MAASVLLLLVAAGVFVTLVRVTSTPATNQRAGPPPSQGATSSPFKKSGPLATLVAPDHIGGRAKLTDAEYSRRAAKTETALKGTLNQGGSIVVAFYGTPDPKQDQIFVVGSTMPGPVKKATFDKEFVKTGPSIGGQPVTGIVDIAPGQAGGFVRCGQTTKDAMNVAVCAWSNEYCFVVVQWYNRTLNNDIKKEIVTIRGLVEKN
ncbi:MAG TPA: hypothetical protein DGT23_34070 [Micromonosporaceae bacterium]|nr:hypothetical protein [Micromonosporaceae bacterium]